MGDRFDISYFIIIDFRGWDYHAHSFNPIRVWSGAGRKRLIKGREIAGKEEIC